MSSMLQINLKSGASAATVKARLRFDSLSGYVPRCINSIADFITGIAGAVHSGRIVIATSAVQATGTITLSSSVANDTVTIGTVTLTESSSTQDGTHFKHGATDTITAANLATCIGANTTLNRLVTATSSGAIVTVTAITPGLIGNQIALAISAHGSVSASYMASGSQDAPVTFYNGL